MKTRLLLFLLCLLINLPDASAQNSPEPYAADWRLLDSLLSNSLPQSAEKKAQQVYELARKNKQPVQQLKAQLYLLYALQNGNRTDSPQRALALAEREARTQPFPLSNIWHSYAGELYYRYFQNNSWRIRQRTAQADADSTADITEWSADRILQTAAAHYQASLGKPGELIRTGLADYQPLLVRGVNSAGLRPTLYDLLAFRALDYFETGYQGLTQPADVFTIDDPRYFAPAEAFVAFKIVTTDSSSSEAQALRIYQQLLRLHQHDADPAALIDAELHRLAFVYSHAALEEKDNLYKTALLDLAARYKGSDGAAEALYRVQATRYYQEANTYGENEIKEPSGLLKIGEDLETIIGEYPESEGAAHARHLLRQLRSPALNVQAEEVVLPGEPSKVSLAYRNVATVYFRLLALDGSMAERLRRTGPDSLLKNRLAEIEPEATWQVALPGGDYREHRAEVSVKPLPLGSYLLLVSNSPAWRNDSALVQTVPFQVSRLSIVNIAGQSGNTAGVVADRKTGVPLAGVFILLERDEYDPKTKQTAIGTYTTLSSENGFVEIASGLYYRRMTMTRMGDTLRAEGYFNYPSRSQTLNDGEEADTTVWFFTDRAIYRPGQEVFFKGIAIRTAGGSSRVIPAYRGTVLLSDVNYVEVDSVSATANEFGSFHGSFRLPAGSLTGEWSIRDATLKGRRSIQVEEYKRPRFEVRFDTLSGSYGLNQEVKVRGSAQAFSGAQIDGAQVRYKVQRQAEYPWFGGFGRRYGYSPRQEISSGTTVTDAAGGFVITFNTKIPSLPDSNAVYRYEVSAEITDGTGETQRGATVLRAGYRNLIIEVPVSQVKKLADVDTFPLYTYNLNQVFQPAEIRVTIEALEAPLKPLRSRLWRAPDRFVMDSVTFKMLFPNDEYREEGNPEHWSRRQVYSGSKRSRKDGSYGLPRSAFAANGEYRLLFSGKDSNGRYVETERFITLRDASLPTVNAAALSITPTSNMPAPGTSLGAVVSTAFDTATVFRIAKSNSREIFSVQTLLAGAPARWQDKALSGKEDKLQLTVWTIHDNRLYQREEYIVPAADSYLNVTWASHRGRLRPGAAETWTLTVKGKQGDKVAAEVAASLYDASLDQFVQHNWWQHPLTGSRSQSISLQPLLFNVAYAHDWGYPRRRKGIEWNKRYDQLMTVYFNRYALRREHLFDREQDMALYEDQVGTVDDISGITGGVAARYGPSYGGAIPGAAYVNHVADVNPSFLAVGQLTAVRMNTSGNASPSEVGSFEEGVGGNNGQPAPITPRRNLRETAFFFPDLRTDDSGNITLVFSLPEALTQWRLLAFAHTKDLRTGLLEGTIRTQKDLMVTPGLPRFLRQGDTINLSAKITNLSDHALAGTARLEVLDAATLQPLHNAFRLTKTEQPFSANTAGSTAVSWTVTVPLSRYEPVLIRITARSGAFTDGEDNTLPLLTNRTLVTETQSLWLNGNGTKSFSLPSLAQMTRAVTPPSGEPEGAIRAGAVTPHALTVEYTANPAWLALQALPYLAEYPYECAEQTFNRYYANALAAHILTRAPKLKAIFARWQQSDTAALLSKLELNPELKSALLEETPWVLEAAGEREQRAGIARLFSASRAASGSASALRKLRGMQSGDGSFPWFSGGGADRYITQYIATGLARMQKLGVKLSGEGKTVLEAAQHYLDGQLIRDYREARKSKNAGFQPQVDPLQVEQLYLSSLLPQRGDTALTNARRYFSDGLARHWATLNPYLKGLAYLALRADGGYPQTTPTILQSLRETSIRDEEQGAFWIRPGAGYYWHEAPIEAQALLIECFAAAGDSGMVSDARRWLLKQKQTQHWATTKATADACYALLLTGADWTRATPQVSIRLGDYTVSSESEQSEAGTGYFKRSISREQISASMSSITVEVKGSTTTQPGWGAVYYQYFADMDAVRSSTDSSRPGAPLSVKKQFFVVRNTKSGEVLEAITQQSPLKVGDKVRVRVVLTADRELDYVHLKDSRASCLEPVDVLSGYRWQDGLGYYQSTRDGSTNFFIDHLRRGTAVFEYSLFVTSRGDFGAGLATAQCMYAPEFAAHSQGARIEVR